MIERVERGREFEPTVGEIREEDIWKRKGEKESEETPTARKRGSFFVLISYRQVDGAETSGRAHFVRRKVVTKFRLDGTINMNAGKKKRSKGAEKRKKKRRRKSSPRKWSV